MLASKIKNIFFDLDGTLTFSKPGITRSIRYALSKLGHELPEDQDLDWCIGPPLTHSFALLLNDHDETRVSAAITHYRERYTTTGMYENEVIPGIPEALSRLRDPRCELRLFITTSKPIYYASKIVEHLNLSQFFDDVHGSELDGTHAEKAHLVRHVLNHHQLSPAETIIIGDRKHDILGGKKNGIYTGAVTFGYGSADEIAAAQPDTIFDNPLQIAEFFTNHHSLS